MGVEQQVMLLDKAAIILAPHGAALTNIAYLKAPLCLIEVIGAQTPRAVFMHIASMLEFQYHGIFSYFFDEDRNIKINLDELREIVDMCVS